MQGILNTDSSFVRFVYFVVRFFIAAFTTGTWPVIEKPNHETHEKHEPRSKRETFEALKLGSSM